MTNFLKNRRSVREFRNKKVDRELLNNIEKILGELGKEEKGTNINFKLIEDGEGLSNRLKGAGGYSGVMIESPHYISLELIENEESNIIYGAYLMEKVITELNRLGLDTCWVSLDKVDLSTKIDLFDEIKGSIDYILALGYGKRKNPFVNESFSERIGVEELVYDGELEQGVNIDDLENRGLGDLFYYVRFAPSAFNKQPWRFLLGKDSVKLLLKYNKNEKPNLMDAGIIMYYFEVLAETLGISGKWKLLDEPVIGDEENKYKFIGEIKL